MWPRPGKLGRGCGKQENCLAAPQRDKHRSITTQPSSPGRGADPGDRDTRPPGLVGEGLHSAEPKSRGSQLHRLLDGQTERCSLPCGAAPGTGGSTGTRDNAEELPAQSSERSRTPQSTAGVGGGGPRTHAMSTTEKSTDVQRGMDGGLGAGGRGSRE